MMGRNFLIEVLGSLDVQIFARCRLCPFAQSLLFPSALAFAHLALPAALMAALPAALIRLLPLLAGLESAAPSPLTLAQRIFLALARALISLRRWAGDSLRFCFTGSESTVSVHFLFAHLAFAAADILALTAADLRPLPGPSGLDGVGVSPSPPPAMESSWLCSVSICSLMATMVLSWLVVKSVSLVMRNGLMPAAVWSQSRRWRSPGRLSGHIRLMLAVDHPLSAIGRGNHFSRSRWEFRWCSSQVSAKCPEIPSGVTNCWSSDAGNWTFCPVVQRTTTYRAVPR
jgi:hypothetical protein